MTSHVFALVILPIQDMQELHVLDAFCFYGCNRVWHCKGKEIYLQPRRMYQVFSEKRCVLESWRNEDPWDMQSRGLYQPSQERRWRVMERTSSKTLAFTEKDVLKLFCWKERRLCVRHKHKASYLFNFSHECTILLRKGHSSHYCLLWTITWCLPNELWLCGINIM